MKHQGIGRLGQGEEYTPASTDLEIRTEVQMQDLLRQREEQKKIETLKVCEDLINALKWEINSLKKLKQQQITRNENRMIPKHVRMEPERSWHRMS